MISDYRVLWLNGITYIERAGTNWDNRRRRLLDAWCYETNIFKKNRLYKLISLIEDRMKTITFQYHDFKNEQKKKQRIADHQPVMYTCTNPYCLLGGFENEMVGHGIVILAKDYNPETKYYCDECGEKMQCEADKLLNEIL